MCVLCLGSMQTRGLGRCICKGPTEDSPLQLWLGKSSHGSHPPWIASTSLPDCNLALEAALNLPTDLDRFVVREQEKGLNRWLAGDFSRAFGDRAEILLTLQL